VVAIGIGRSALTEQVSDAIRELIMDQVLAPGLRLNIAHLARQLGVSETPVREALGRLRAERLLTFEPYLGYTVVPLLTVERLDELLDVRILMESYAARRGAARICDDALARMRDAVGAMDGLPAGPTFHEHKDFNANDRAFHTAIIEAAGNTVLSESYQSLNHHIVLARLYFGRGLAEITASQHGHHQILRAYEARDSARAETAVVEHIEGARGRLRALLARVAGDDASCPSDLDGQIHVDVGPGRPNMARRRRSHHGFAGAARERGRRR
jgi:DNA-binding GntR family transcriptional regulator